MKLSSRLSFLASLLALTGAAHAAEQPAYLETAPVTLLWNFNITGISGTTLGTTPIPTPDGGASSIEDPEKLRPVDRITTEVGRPITYTETGTQSFFIKHMLRGVIESYAEAAKGNTNASERAFYLSRVTYLKNSLNGRWELTAVREPQTSVTGITTTPYTIFLTRVEPVAVGRPTFNFRTNLSLVPVASVANTSETLTAGRVTKASGTVTTHYVFTFSSFYSDSPLYLVDEDKRDAAIEGEDYNLSGSYWFARASGYMTHSVRITKGLDPAVVPTKFNVTGVGSWSVEITGNNPRGYTGTAPLRIAIGEPKFQDRTLFPDFTSP